MRLIKMIGLAAIAAVTAMAFVGVSSASAANTALCLKNESPCLTKAHLLTLSFSPATENIYTGHIEGLAVDPELLSDLANVTCKHSVILGSALGLGAPQVTHLELIDFTTDCLTELGVSCTVTTVALGLVDLLRTGLNEGLVTSLNSKVKVVCLGVINCVFGGEPDGTAVGSAATLSSNSLGTITVSQSELEGTGILCPKVGKWDAKYTIVLPHELFITS